MLKGKFNKTGIDYGTDLNDLDSMLEKYSMPKQDMPGFNNANHDRQSTIEPETATNESVNDIFDPVTQSTEKQTENKKEFDPEKNKRTGLRIARTIDRFAAFGSMKVALSNDMSTYQATQNELNDLGDEWSEYTKDMNIDMPPWMSLAILNFTVYMPKVVKAFNDKRLHEQQNQINNHDEQLDNLKRKVDNLENEQKKE